MIPGSKPTAADPIGSYIPKMASSALVWTLDAIVQRQDVAATMALDAVAFRRLENLVTFQLAVSQGRQASMVLDAIATASLLSTTAFDAAIRQQFQLGMDADLVTVKAFLVSSVLDALVEVRLSASATIDLATQKGKAATATLDLRIIETGFGFEDTVLSVIAQGTDLTLTSDLDAVVAVSFLETASLDVSVAAQSTIVALLDASVRQSLSAQTTLGVLAMLVRERASTLDIAVSLGVPFSIAATLEVMAKSIGISASTEFSLAARKRNLTTQATLSLVAGLIHSLSATIQIGAWKPLAASAMLDVFAVSSLVQETGEAAYELSGTWRDEAHLSGTWRDQVDLPSTWWSET